MAGKIAPNTATPVRERLMDKILIQSSVNTMGRYVKKGIWPSIKNELTIPPMTPTIMPMIAKVSVSPKIMVKMCRR